jgi:hypothetical protein
VISSKTGGWAANAHLQARLADFGTVDMVGQTSTPGWGSIEKKVNEGLEKLTDEYLGGKGFSPGEDYGWSFGKLPLQIVLTEEKRGIWKSRLIGPDWLVVDSMSVNSLPAEQYTENKERKLQFMVGGGYNKSLSPNGPNSIAVGGGVNLFSNHNILLNLAISPIP